MEMENILIHLQVKMVVSCHIDTRNIDTLSLSIVTLTRLYDHADHPDNPTGEMVVSFVI